MSCVGVTEWESEYAVLLPHSFPLTLWEQLNFPHCHESPDMLQILGRLGGWMEYESVEVRRRGCLTLRWRRLCRGSSCRSCVPSDCRWCSSSVPRWWRKLCRRLISGHLSDFLCCCQTGYYTGSSAASKLLGPKQNSHISDINRLWRYMISQARYQFSNWCKENDRQGLFSRGNEKSCVNFFIPIVRQKY